MIQPASFFPAQPANTFGNMTRYNPKFRAFANYNENFSLAKTFSISERLRADFRAEMFNAIPTGPGLSVQVNESALEKYRAA